MSGTKFEVEERGLCDKFDRGLKALVIGKALSRMQKLSPVDFKRVKKVKDSAHGNCHHGRRNVGELVPEGSVKLLDLFVVDEKLNFSSRQREFGFFG